MQSRKRHVRWLWLILFVAIVLHAHHAHAHPPTGIVVDKADNVYFTDLETVWKFDTRNRLSVLRPGVRGRHVHELAIDKDGNLYGADLSYENEQWVSGVWKIAPGGQLTYLVAPTTSPPRGAGIWIDEHGNMYSVEQNNHTKTQTVILKLQPDRTANTLAGGDYGLRDGKGSEAQLSSIGGMTFGPDGRLYFTDGNTLRRVSMDGMVTTLARDLTKRNADDRWTLFGRNDGMLTGLSVDPAGNVYVADAGNQRLLKIDMNGVVDVNYRGDSPYYPNGVFAPGNGNLYVLEVGWSLPGRILMPRVRKITPDGKSSVIAVAGNENTGDTKQPGQFILTTTSTGVPLKTLLTVGFAVMILGVVLLIWQRNRRRLNKEGVR